MKRSFHLRVAEMEDRAELESLISRSAFELQKEVYSEQQIQSALGPVFGVDCQLIRDGTYYVAVSGKAIVGCGGWSFRKAEFGGSDGRDGECERLDPRRDPARIRAFFVDPAFARHGIGTALVVRCETAAMEANFASIEIVATLVGERLYERFGYKVLEHVTISLRGAPPMGCVRMTKNLGIQRYRN